MSMYTRLVIIACKALQQTLRFSGKSSGTALPGLLAEKLQPDILKYYAQQLDRKPILVTGTNGKTTTARILASCLKSQGYELITNSSGSNFSRGIVGSLIEKSNYQGKIKASGNVIGVFEVDEAFVERISKVLNPYAVVALNIFRDQLDRFGELDTVAYMIGQSLAYTQNAVLNIDDSLIWELRKYCGDETHVQSFGVSSHLQNRYTTDDQLYSSNGKKKKLKPSILLEKIQQEDYTSTITLKGLNSDYSVITKLPGIHNALNIAAVAATLAIPGLMKPSELQEALKSIGKVAPPFGRGESLDLGEGRSVLLNLVKNPAGMNQIINSFLKHNDYDVVCFVLNDNFADGRDISWIWDSDLQSANLGRSKILIAGTRSYDMAIRLDHTETEVDVLPTIQKMLIELKRALLSDQRAIIISTYTGMLELRTKLHEMGHEISRIHEDE